METFLKNIKEKIFYPARLVFEEKTPEKQVAPEKGKEKGKEPGKKEGALEADKAVVNVQSQEQQGRLKPELEKQKAEESKEEKDKQAQKPAEEKKETTEAGKDKKETSSKPQEQVVAPPTKTETPEDQKAKEEIDKFADSTFGQIISFFYGGKDGLVKSSKEGSPFLAFIMGIAGYGVAKKLIDTVSEKSPTAKGLFDKIKDFFGGLFGPSYEKFSAGNLALIKESTTFDLNHEINGDITLNKDAKIVLHKDNKHTPSIKPASDIMVTIGSEKKNIPKDQEVPAEDGKDIVINADTVIKSGTKFSKGWRIEIIKQA